jgi:2-dehydro-3-deoxyphosphogluconate aldolase/(4S)-4-hydroxy-2-oxoglutarate aldolase
MSYLIESCAPSLQKQTIAIQSGGADNFLDRLHLLQKQSITALEITLRDAHAWDRIKLALDNRPADLKIGVGTITNTSQWQQACDMGVDFAMSPGFDPSLAAMIMKTKLTKKTGPLYIPGIASASELMQAHRLGYRIIKVFPINCLGGLDFMNQIGNLMTETYFIPSGGLTQKNTQAYLNNPFVWSVAGSFLWSNTQTD